MDERPEYVVELIDASRPGITIAPVAGRGGRLTLTIFPGCVPSVLEYDVHLVKLD